MGGGNHSTSTTNPTIPPELSGLYRTVGNAIVGSIGDMPLSNYYQMDPRQYAGLSEAERTALNLTPGMLNPSTAGTAAFNMASNLGNLNDWYGADLNGVGGLGNFSLGSPVRIGQGGIPPMGGGQPPGQPLPPGVSPRPSGGGVPPSGGGFGFVGSAYQGVREPPQQPPQQPPQTFRRARLPLPFQATAPMSSS